MKQFCCDQMDYEVLNDKAIYYDKSTRYYAIKLCDDSDGTLLPIYHCPWCGAKLPKDLSEVWEEILSKEFNIKEPAFNEHKIPQEFRTDQWWKKRGL